MPFRFASRWIGFSLIAIFEILDLVCQLVYQSCIKQQQKKTKIQPVVEIAVIDLSNNSSQTRNNLEDTESIDEIVLVK
jgi:hypothetical protein